MLVILNRNRSIEKPDTLVLHETIFPRPTPWKVAWKAWLTFLVFRDSYQFAFIPRKYKLYHYDADVEGDELVLRVGNQEIKRFDILKMDWGLWVEYTLESFMYGLFFKFWEWRWDAGGRLTKEEPQAKMEALEQKVEAMQRRKTQRIEQDTQEDPE